MGCDWCGSEPGPVAWLRFGVWKFCDPECRDAFEVEADKAIVAKMHPDTDWASSTEVKP